ncbi:hypothetical protein D3C72_1871520 [compost metagenome]
MKARSQQNHSDGNHHLPIAFPLKHRSIKQTLVDSVCCRSVIHFRVEVNHGQVSFFGYSRACCVDGGQRPVAAGRGAALLCQRECCDQASTSLGGNRHGCPLAARPSAGQRQAFGLSAVPDCCGRAQTRHHHAGTGRQA